MRNSAVDQPRIAVGARQLRALLENSDEMYALLSADSTYLFANASAAKILGYTMEELIGRNGLDLVHLEDQRMCRERLGELLANPGGTVHVQCRIVARDGSSRWVECVAKNLLADPEIRALVVNYRDVNHRVRAEAERQVLSDVIHALTLTNHLDELLGEIHVGLNKVLPAGNCFVAVCDRVAGLVHFP